jgi:hypothetical protein
MKKTLITIFLLSIGYSLFSQELPPSVKYGKQQTRMMIKNELDSLSKIHSVDVIVFNTIETDTTILSEIFYNNKNGTTGKKLLRSTRKLSIPVSLSNHSNSVKLK